MKPRLFAPLLFVLLSAAHAPAATIYVNDPIITGIAPVANSTIFGGKYRISNTNFDLSLGMSDDTANAATYQNAGVGDAAALRGTSWNFRLQHIPSEGVVFTLFRTTPSLVEHILSWGTFSTPPGGTNVNFLPTNGTLTPERPYNSLNITAKAGASNSTVTLANLAFSSPTLTLSPGSTFVNATYPTNSGSTTQRILINGDFSQHAYTLTGLVTLFKTGNGCDECATFSITGSSVTADFPAVPAEVPEPATLGLIASGLLLIALGSLRRR